MCKCTPSFPRPFCGRSGCEWPAQLASNPEALQFPRHLYDTIQQSLSAGIAMPRECLVEILSWACGQMLLDQKEIARLNGIIEREEKAHKEPR